VKLYVGNISFTITEADLQHIFEQFGSVTEIKIVTDRETGQPRGFAFVTLGNDAEGRAAIKSLDGKEFGGRPLKVSEARPKEDRHGRSLRGNATGVCQRHPRKQHHLPLRKAREETQSQIVTNSRQV